MRTIYVVKGSENNDPQLAYLRNFRPAGQLVDRPEIGDTVIDVLEIAPKGDGWEVWSVARKQEIRLSSSWSWGDQYEPGAEYSLADECLGVWYDGRDTLLALDAGPLFPLVYE